MKLENFENEELVLIYKKLKREKEKLDDAIKLGAMVIFKLEKVEEGEGISGFGVIARAKEIDDFKADKIKESVIYQNYEKILTKLEPVVEIILDSDKDVQHKFRNL